MSEPKADGMSEDDQLAFEIWCAGQRAMGNEDLTQVPWRVWTLHNQRRQLAELAKARELLTPQPRLVNVGELALRALLRDWLRLGGAPESNELFRQFEELKDHTSNVLSPVVPEPSKPEPATPALDALLHRYTSAVEARALGHEWIEDEQGVMCEIVAHVDALRERAERAKDACALAEARIEIAEAARREMLRELAALKAVQGTSLPAVRGDALRHR